VGKQKPEVTREELLWLQRNWTPGDRSFREWLQGSERAHALVKRLIEEGLRRLT